MKKVILFLWFGDEKPPYIQWTLENFRKMNPGWEIRYVEYSNAQLSDYKNQNDPVLCETKPNKCFSYWVDSYKWKYLSMHKDEFVIYCDLDCFPIAPFDNFICYESLKLPDYVYRAFCQDTYKLSNLATCANTFNDSIMFKDDMWCITNRKNFMFIQFLQIYKNIIPSETLSFVNGMMINSQDIPKLKKRSKTFHEMKIKLGDNFCLPQFTPIEHYYSFERNKLNKNTELKQ